MLYKVKWRNEQTEFIESCYYSSAILPKLKEIKRDKENKLCIEYIDKTISQLKAEGIMIYCRKNRCYLATDIYNKNNDEIDDKELITK